MPGGRAVRQAQAAAAGVTLNSYRITGVQDAYGSEAMLGVWRQTDRDGKLPLHMVGSLAAMPATKPSAPATLALIDGRGG